MVVGAEETQQELEEIETNNIKQEETERAEIEMIEIEVTKLIIQRNSINKTAKIIIICRNLNHQASCMLPSRSQSHLRLLVKKICQRS